MLRCSFCVALIWLVYVGGVLGLGGWLCLLGDLAYCGWLVQFELVCASWVWFWWVGLVWVGGGFWVRGFGFGNCFWVYCCLLGSGAYLSCLNSVCILLFVGGLVLVIAVWQAGLIGDCGLAGWWGGLGASILCGFTVRRFCLLWVGCDWLVWCGLAQVSWVLF